MEKKQKCSKCGDEFYVPIGIHLKDMCQLFYCEKCVIEYLNVKVSNEILNFNKNLKNEKKKSFIQRASSLIPKRKR